MVNDDREPDLTDWLLKIERRTTDVFLRIEAIRLLLEARGIASAADFAAALETLSKAAAERHQKQIHDAVQDASLKEQTARLHRYLDERAPPEAAS